VAGHGAGVSETEVDITMAVDVVEVRSLSLADNGGKAPAHLTIQFMGTPESSDFLPRS